MGGTCGLHGDPRCFLALTNGAAFSPTDAMPLTRQAKAMMGVQSIISMVTVIVVAARAVNILT